MDKLLKNLDTKVEVVLLTAETFLSYSLHYSIKTNYYLVTVIEKLADDSGDVIQDSIGVFKRWQLYIVFSVSLSKFAVGWQQISIVFLTPPTNFTCAIEEIDKCSSNCPSHVFDRSLFKETIITQWDLVCEREYLTSLSQSTTMLGILVGNMIFGYLADRFGRRRPLHCAVILQLFSGVGCSFVPWFEVFLLLRFLVAAATGGTMVISFVMIMEVVGKKWRTVLGLLYHIPFNLGHMSLALFGYLIRDWRYYHIAISAPSVVFVVWYYFIPESPRWLLSVGKDEEALRVLEKAAKTNKLSVENIKKNIERYNREKETGKDKQKPGNLVDLVRTPIMRKYTIILSYNWFACGLCFFGLAQYVSRLGGDIFVNVFISALIATPGSVIVIYTAKAWGRKSTLVVFNAIAGISCLILSFIPSVPQWIQPSLACIGLLGQMASFADVYIYSGELYPTIVRNAGVGANSMCARIGSILAPFIATLDSIQDWIPGVIFGIIPLTGALLVLALPETLDCQLPDTIEEAEEFEITRKKEKSDTYVSTF